MEKDPTVLEISMSMAMSEIPLADDIDPETLEGIRSTLTTWVINEFIEEQQKEPQEDEEADDPNEILADLIENAVACAYVFAKLTSDAPNQPTSPHPILTSQIIESLLATGTVTLSIIVE